MFIDHSFECLIIPVFNTVLVNNTIVSWFWNNTCLLLNIVKIWVVNITICLYTRNCTTSNSIERCICTCCRINLTIFLEECNDIIYLQCNCLEETLNLFNTFVNEILELSFIDESIIINNMCIFLTFNNFILISHSLEHTTSEFLGNISCFIFCTTNNWKILSY